MSTLNSSSRTPVQQIQSNSASLIYGLILGVVFAVLFFNPFTRNNIAFAVRTEPTMFLTSPTDLSLLALIYFAGVGLVLGGVRVIVRQRIGGLASLPASLVVMFVGSSIFIYGALRLFNPALECMIESCNSTFVFNYALVTFGFSVLLAYNTSPTPPSEPSSPNQQNSRPGCSVNGMSLLIAGVALFGCWMMLLLLIANGIQRGGC